MCEEVAAALNPRSQVDDSLIDVHDVSPWLIRPMRWPTKKSGPAWVLAARLSASPDRPPGRAAAGALAVGQPGTSPSQDSIARLGLRGVIALLEQSPDGVVVCQADDRCYVYANPVACRLMGYRFEELLGRDLLMNFPEREHPAVLARFPGQPGQWTGVLALPGGTERQVT